MSEDATKDSNVAHRKEQVAKAMEQLYQLDCSIKAAIEEHVQFLRDEKTAIKKRLRDDFSMPSKLVSARYSSYRLERHAEDTKDDITLDAIREMYEYLPVGGTVDLVDAMQAADGKTPAS